MNIIRVLKNEQWSVRAHCFSLYTHSCIIAAVFNLSLAHCKISPNLTIHSLKTCFLTVYNSHESLQWFTCFSVLRHHRTGKNDQTQLSALIIPLMQKFPSFHQKTHQRHKLSLIHGVLHTCRNHPCQSWSSCLDSLSSSQLGTNVLHVMLYLCSMCRHYSLALQIYPNKTRLFLNSWVGFSYRHRLLCVFWVVLEVWWMCKVRH